MSEEEIRRVVRNEITDLKIKYFVIGFVLGALVACLISVCVIEGVL